MKKYKFLYIAVSTMTVICVSSSLSSDIGVFFGPSPYLTQQEQQRENLPSPSMPGVKEKYIKRDKFIYLLANKFAFLEEKLQKLHSQGYGYKELIKLLYISRMGEVEFDSVVKLRSRGEKLRNISKRYNVDYNTVVENTDKMYYEIKNELASIPTGFFDTLPLIEDLQNATTEEYKSK